MTWLPWIAREDSAGFAGSKHDALDDGEWERLEALLNKHGAVIKDEDDSGVQIEVLPAGKLVALHDDLYREGFAWLDEDELIDALRSTHDANYGKLADRLLTTNRGRVR